MRSILPRHEFRDLCAFLGVTMKILEVPKTPWIQGFWSDGPGEASNTIYWRETLFSRGTTHSYEFASSLAAISKGEGSSTVPSWSKEKEGKGVAAVVGLRPPPPPLPRAPWSPPLPLGEAHLHHLIQHFFIIPTVISWQTWCVVQSIIFPWFIVSMSKFE
jgi:hypothetical protein